MYFALFAFWIIFYLCLLYCFMIVSSYWLRRPPPKWPRLCRVGHLNSTPTPIWTFCDNRTSFIERYGSSLPGCRSAPFVWYAIQKTSAIITHWPARCPPVAVFNSWRPIVCCGWCSIMEQSATRYCCVRHLSRFRRELKTFLCRHSYPSILF